MLADGEQSFSDGHQPIQTSIRTLNETPHLAPVVPLTGFKDQILAAVMPPVVREDPGGDIRDQGELGVCHQVQPDSLAHRAIVSLEAELDETSSPVPTIVGMLGGIGVVGEPGPECEPVGLFDRPERRSRLDSQSAKSRSAARASSLTSAGQGIVDKRPALSDRSDGMWCVTGIGDYLGGPPSPRPRPYTFGT